jgi:hypothetical protein
MYSIRKRFKTTRDDMNQATAEIFRRKAEQLKPQFNPLQVNPLFLDEKELIHFFMGENAPVEIRHASKLHMQEDGE